jgi:hypothetical protein
MTQNVRNKIFYYSIQTHIFENDDIQIQSFEFLITPSKETLNAMPTL